ncbi:MAG: energy-coupling factor ABC transporter ATP-binding protein [Crenarchaeota archaeon]|nr:energy-coupling factor ABC transporter ATP-binding protein [Thermoproteota archaeon]
MPRVIEVADMWFKYRTSDDWTLREIDMNVEKGSIVALLGVNGSGKTTLLKVLAGIVIHQKGTVKICDIELNRKNVKRIREKVGLVLQDPETHLLMPTVREELSIPLIARGLSEKEIEEKIIEVARILEIEKLLDRGIDELSFGQKKRVSIASALILEPEILLLDEPTLGLDPVGCIKLMDLVTDIAKRKNITIIFSTQDIDIAALYSDYVYVIRDGKIVAKGPRDELLRDPYTLRQKCGLRLTRIAHLFEIAIRRRITSINELPITISEALKILERIKTPSKASV